MYRAFLQLCKMIARVFPFTPLLYGSLGLERLTGENLNADDVDVLIPTEYVLGDRWLDFKRFLEQNGFVLIDEHEHTFRKDGISFSFACVEELASFAGVSQDDLSLVKDGEVSYYLLNLQQYLAVYKRSAKDGYRIHKKEKRDGEKIALITKQLKLKEKGRCRWCNLKNERYLEYHDSEWGVPNFSDPYLYEMLLLESFQAGLSWECVLNKRDAFRQAYDGFDLEKVIAYGKEKTEKLMQNKGIIRNRRKIEASIQNSKIFKEIAEEFGSFANYLTSFTKGKTLYETEKTRNALSDALSEDLQKRGMRFVGSVIIYSFLQAIGVIHSHDKDCFLYQSGE